MADNDFRIKTVAKKMAELNARPAYVLDRLEYEDQADIGANETIEIPGLGAYTVSSDASVAVTPQSSTADNIDLVINKHPGVFVDVPRLDRLMNMGGGDRWASSVARNALSALRNDMDEAFLKDASTVAAYSDASSPAYTSNPAGDTIERQDLVEAIARLSDQDGAGSEAEMLWVLDPWAMAAIRNLADFIPNGTAAERGFVGLPLIGSLFNIPVVQTRSVLKSHSVAISGAVISSNSCTLTVSAGHGFVVGEKAVTAGLTTNATSAVAITAVGATTIELPITASDGAMADQVGTITSQASRSMLLDTTHCHSGVVAMPDLRIKPKTGTSTEELEVTSVYGFCSRPGRCVNVYGPVGGI